MAKTRLKNRVDTKEWSCTLIETSPCQQKKGFEKGFAKILEFKWLTGCTTKVSKQDRKDNPGYKDPVALYVRYWIEKAKLFASLGMRSPDFLICQKHLLLTFDPPPGLFFLVTQQQSQWVTMSNILAVWHFPISWYLAWANVSLLLTYSRSVTSLQMLSMLITLMLDFWDPNVLITFLPHIILKDHLGGAHINIHPFRPSIYIPCFCTRPLLIWTSLYSQPNEAVFRITYYLLQKHANAEEV